MTTPQSAENLCAEAMRLHGANRLDEAIAAYRKVLTVDPEYIEAQFNLAVSLEARDRFAEAEAAYRQAWALDPACVPAGAGLAGFFYRQGKMAEAEKTYQSALTLAPENPDLLHNLANVYYARGDRERAIAHYERAITHRPEFADAYHNLASACQDEGRLQDATRHYRRAVELDPENISARHILDALTGNNTAAAPRNYIEPLFDQYADRFEEHLGKLEYRSPAILHRALEMAAGASGVFENVLDIGCGTGLMGSEIRRRSGHLTGIDLSAKMLARAAEKKIYDELRQAEAVEFMQNSANRFDLILAADVFVYAGDLGRVFRAMRQAARRGCIIAFTTEHLAGGDFRLMPSGRYIHGQKYVLARAGEHHLRPLLYEIHNIRKNGASWVPGGVFVLQLLEPSD